jgi:hypothetical protein
MKKQTSLLLALSAVLWCSCNFSVGTKKDLLTGLSFNYNGFSVEEAYLAGPDDVPIKGNEVAMNSQVAIVLQGIENYTLKVGKAFPGLMLIVTDAQGNAVIDEADLFAATEGYSATDASALRGTVTIGNPMESGETYHTKMRVWDKNNPANEITAEVDLKVQ